MQIKMKKYLLMEKVRDMEYKQVSKSYNKKNIELRKKYYSDIYPTKTYVIWGISDDKKN